MQKTIPLRFKASGSLCKQRLSKDEVENEVDADEDIADTEDRQGEMRRGTSMRRKRKLAYL